MEKILKYFSETFPKYDSFLSLLLFLLMVFGGLYVFFQIIFKLGDASLERKKEKAEKKKGEKKAEPMKKDEKEEKPQKVEAKNQGRKRKAERRRASFFGRRKAICRD